MLRFCSFITQEDFMLEEIKTETNGAILIASTLQIIVFLLSLVLQFKYTVLQTRYIYSSKLDLGLKQVKISFSGVRKYT